MSRHDPAVLRRCTALIVLMSGIVLLHGGCERPADRGSDESEAASAPSAAPWFEESAQARGIDHVFESGHHERYLLPQGVSGGAALFDMDDDGDLDLYLLQGGRIEGADAAPPSGNRLFRNDGRGRFEDVTALAGVDDRRYGMGVACADYDNDRDVDLFVTNYGRDTLYRNDGGGRFTDVTDAAGVGHDGLGAGAAFVDYDRDGDLDLFVTNYVDWSPAVEITCFNWKGAPDYCKPTNYDRPAPDVLYRNNGDGTFTDVTAEAGIHASIGTGLGVVCGDYDGDGWLDIFVANDGMRNHLWLNRRDGTFVDVAVERGCALDNQGLAKAGMGVTTQDVDDDGDLDLLVCNLGGETDSFFRNEEGRYFLDTTARAGLSVTSKPFTRFGMGWVDFDHDGRLDLYQCNGRIERKGHTFAEDPYAEPNVLMRGGADGRFEEVSPRGGVSEELIHASRAAAFGDIDNDGGVDIVVVNRDGPTYLLRNVVPDRGHWVLVRALDVHGRDAEGATVRVRAEGRTRSRDIRTAYSYFAANDPRAHFGLASSTQIEEITVRWVDGSEESFGPQEVDRILTLRQGEGAAVGP